MAFWRNEMAKFAPCLSIFKFPQLLRQERPRQWASNFNLLSHVGQKVEVASEEPCCPFWSMQPKTEDFLNLMLWASEQLLRPTFRNLTGSYESWAYRNGLFAQVAKLEKQKFLQRDSSTAEDRVYRLTDKGRLHALGGRDPQACWSRDWDGYWRLVSFDIPTTQNTHRRRLRRYLREKGFGFLQDSLWITPDPLTEEREILCGGKINVESLFLLEGRPCAGESDAEIVAGAWDFETINRRYVRYLRVLDYRPGGALKDETAAKMLLRWATAEREAWLTAVSNDPLLPENILPSNYLGRQVWQRRIEVLRKAGKQLQTFHI